MSNSITTVQRNQGLIVPEKAVEVVDAFRHHFQLGNDVEVRLMADWNRPNFDRGVVIVSGYQLWYRRSAWRRFSVSKRRLGIYTNTVAGLNRLIYR